MQNRNLFFISKIHGARMRAKFLTCFAGPPLKKVITPFAWLRKSSKNFSFVARKILPCLVFFLMTALTQNLQILNRVIFTIFIFVMNFQVSVRTTFHTFTLIMLKSNLSILRYSASVTRTFFSKFSSINIYSSIMAYSRAMLRASGCRGSEGIFNAAFLTNKFNSFFFIPATCFSAIVCNKTNFRAKYLIASRQKSVAFFTFIHGFIIPNQAANARGLYATI